MAGPPAWGDELTPSFHGDNGNARKDQGRADLEAMMFCSARAEGQWFRMSCLLALSPHEQSPPLPSPAGSRTGRRVHI